MTKLTFFGTGYSIATAKRHNTSLFLQTGNTDLLIDCNGICSQQLARQNVALKDLEHMYLTHEHPDHIAAIPNLIHQMWVKTCLYCGEGNERTKTLNIYCNSRTKEIVTNLLETISIFMQDKMFPIIFHVLNDEGGELNINDDIVLDYFPVNHGDTPCLGFAVKSDTTDKKLVYSADTSPSNNIYSCLNDGDIMIHDCNLVDQEQSTGHTTWLQLQQILKENPPIQLYLVHLPDMDDPQESALKTALEKDYKDIVFLGEDGLQFTF